MSETLLNTSVPSHGNSEDFDAVLWSKGSPTAQGLYPADGTAEVIEVETRVAALEGVTQHELIAYHSGMTAVGRAVETSLLAGPRGVKKTIAAPQQSYSETSVMLQKYANYGVGILWYDSGDADNVLETLEIDRPTVLLAETVSNGPEMPVLNYGALLEAHRATSCPSKSTIVLDNTLPLSTGLNLANELREDDKIIVAGSGMKGITKNVEFLGVTYSKNPELLDRLRRDRVTERGMPGPASSKILLDVLLSVDTEEDRTEAKELYDARNTRIFENNFELAKILHQAQLDGAPFVVNHPGVGDHLSRDYVERTFARGIAPTPVFYLKCTEGDLAQKALASQLFDRSPDVQKHAELQQSFAFDHTAIAHARNVPYVRIATGANTDVEELGAALYSAALR